MDENHCGYKSTYWGVKENGKYFFTPRRQQSTRASIEFETWDKDITGDANRDRYSLSFTLHVHYTDTEKSYVNMTSASLTYYSTNYYGDFEWETTDDYSVSNEQYNFSGSVVNFTYSAKITFKDLYTIFSLHCASSDTELVCSLN